MPDFEIEGNPSNIRANHLADTTHRNAVKWLYA